MQKKPKIAALQMCSVNDVETNLQHVQYAVEEAHRNGAALIVLPEMFVTMDDTMKKKICEVHGQGPIQTFLAKLAQHNKIWIVAGTLPIADQRADKFSAACLVYDDYGNCVARYNKIHLFDVKLSDKEIYQESASIIPGSDIVVIESPVGKLGVAVCFDIRFPDQFKKMVELGAEIIAIPAAFTVKTGQAHWEILMRSRAIDNFCYLIAACQGGRHPNGRETYGHSMIVAPWGNILASENQNHKGLIYAEIDLTKVHEARRTLPVVS